MLNNKSIFNIASEVLRNNILDFYTLKNEIISCVGMLVETYGSFDNDKHQYEIVINDKLTFHNILTEERNSRISLYKVESVVFKPEENSIFHYRNVNLNCSSVVNGETILINMDKLEDSELTHVSLYFLQYLRRLIV